MLELVATFISSCFEELLLILFDRDAELPRWVGWLRNMLILAAAGGLVYFLYWLGHH